MSYTSAPVPVNGQTLDIPNPSAGGSNPPAVAVQVQNDSSYQLTNNFDGNIINANSAYTIQNIPTGSDLILTVVNYVALEFAGNTGTGSVGAEWLEAGENSSQADGPVSSAAALTYPYKLIDQVITEMASTLYAVPPGVLSSRAHGVLVASGWTIQSARISYSFFGVAVFFTLPVVELSPAPDSDGNVLGLYYIPLVFQLTNATFSPQIEYLWDGTAQGSTKIITFEVDDEIDFGAIATAANSGGTTVGAWTLIDSVVLSSSEANITFSNIPSKYNHLKVMGVLKATSAANLAVTINGDTGANYNYQSLAASSSSVSAAVDTAQTEVSGIAGINTSAVAIGLDIPCYSQALTKQGVLTMDNAVSSSEYIGRVAFEWNSTAAVDEIEFAAVTNAWAAGSALYLYGIE